MGKRWSGLRFLGLGLCLLAAIGVYASGRAAWGSWYPIAYAGTPVTVTGAEPDAILRAVGPDGGPGDQIATAPCPQAPGSTCWILPSGLRGEVQIMDNDNKRLATYSVVGAFQLAVAGGAVLCLFLGLPWAIYPRYVDAWPRLLSEAGGGLSLGRVQLALWGGAAALAYFALAISQGAFVAAPDEIWKLLLLAGATGVVALGANPPQGQDLDDLRSATKALLIRLRALAPDASPLPPELQQALSETGAALNALQPGTWEPARGLVEKSLLEVFISLKDRATVPQPVVDQVTQPLYTDPTDLALTQVKTAWGELLRDLQSTPVFRTETEAANQALAGYWGTSFAETDASAFVDGANRAIDLMVRDLAAAKIALPQAVARAVTEVKQDLALADHAVPKLADLIENWHGEGDFSRLQYLILTIGAVAVFLMQFFRTGAFPVVPDQFLWLVGASQATYVGVKWGQKLTQGAGN